MKCKFFLVCLLLGLAPARLQATSAFYVNDSVVSYPEITPPLDIQVDATNFINNNFFSINFTNLLLLPSGQIIIQPPFYSTANTRNYTNTGVMICNGGFVFDWFDTVPTVDTHKMAANFENSGTISCGSGANSNFFFNLFFDNHLPIRYQVAATNISLRSSTNIIGVDGLFSLTGKHVDLNRANITMEGFEENLDSLFAGIDTVGLTAAYWGIGTNVMNPVVNFEFAPPTTPFHVVTTPQGFALGQVLQLPSAVFYEREFIVGTNRIVQAVFISNTNAAILNNVYFPNLGTVLVEWLGRQTNPVSGVVTTNRLYLTDDFGTFFTNGLFANFSYYSANATAIPFNYNFTRFNPFLFGAGAPATPSSPVGVFDSLVVSNDFAAFGAVFAPTTVLLSNLPPSGRFLTNLPGRMVINADSTMDLRFSQIVGANYMGLKVTNHVVGTGGANISVPFSDIYLATTNGNLAITNLLQPVVQRFTGEVDLWSGRWTNAGGGFTTTYSVLFVDSQLDAVAPAQIQDLTLRSTNVLISDVMNVTRSLLIDAEHLTITTNQQPAHTLSGEINLLSPAITWSSALPRLQSLTNNGIITALNSVFFGGARTTPFFNSNFDEPYVAFVNRGSVTTGGSLIWADYFENSGYFNTGIGFGSISLQSQDTRLTNGSFLAINGNISIGTDNLIVTNHLLHAGRRLNLSVTNFITDAGASNANNWIVGRGFDLPIKPTTGDLLGTTISETAGAGVENVHTWAGEDRDAVPAGFSNNAALGRLILNGNSSASLFTFTGTGASNALYVDYLDLRNFATNINASGNLSALSNANNMVIYYAQAVAGGVSVAERLNFANGGRLRWVSEYAGIYSSTNLVYPDGTTNSLNAALVQSRNLDSDGDGIVNADDPTPVLRPQDVVLNVALTDVPSKGALLTWRSVPYSTNTVYFKSLPAGGWVPLTNVQLGPFDNSGTVFDPMPPSGTRFYRVEVGVPKP